MDVRKIIAFGKSSFVISLPKAWLNDHNLKKGDTVFLSQEEGMLSVTPEEKHKEHIEKRTIIKVDKKSRGRIEREISAAFINYNDYIILEGKDLHKHAVFITDIIHNLIALEVMEQSHDKIVARDFLKVGDVHVQEYFRKADITVRSMLADLKDPKFKDFGGVVQRQDAVKRIHLLLLKIFKAVFDDTTRLRKLELPYDEVLRYYRYNFGMLYLSQRLKNISLQMKGLKDPKMLATLRELIGTLEQDYLELLKAIITKNPEKALTFSERRDERIKEIKKKIPPSSFLFLSSMIFMHRELHELAHRVYS